MNKVFLILAIEFSVFLAFVIFIYRLVKRDIKRYRQHEHMVPAESPVTK